MDVLWTYRVISHIFDLKHEMKQMEWDMKTLRKFESLKAAKTESYTGNGTVKTSPISRQ